MATKAVARKALTTAEKQAATVRSTLRGLLRAVGKSLDNAENPRPRVLQPRETIQSWRRVLLGKYRAAQHVTDAVQQQRLQRTAEDYLTLLTSLRAHEVFLRDGGWGLKSKEEDRIGVTARRVGLGMPTEHPQLSASGAAAALKAPTVVTPAGVEAGVPASAISQRYVQQRLSVFVDDRSIGGARVLGDGDDAPAPAAGAGAGKRK